MSAASLPATARSPMRGFDYNLLTEADQQLAVRFLGSYRRLKDPDFVIAPDGAPYLYRWYLAPRNETANVYFHIQVADDPDRPLHDHFYDNQSVILAGGYIEHVRQFAAIGHPERYITYTYRRTPGQTVQRKAEEAHRLTLPPGVPYSMSLFTTGPRRRDWGFYYPDGWRSHAEVIEDKDGVSVVKETI